MIFREKIPKIYHDKGFFEEAIEEFFLLPPSFF